MQGRLDPGTLRPLKKQTTEAPVADATSAYYIDGTTASDNCVLMVSATDFPDTVENSAAAAVQARMLLGSGLGDTVCVPKLVERYEGRSFAVYPRLQAFSDNWFVQRAQKLRVAGDILQWLTAVAVQTAVSHAGAADLEQRFFRPLQNLIDDDDIPSGVRQSAKASLAAVQAGQVRTVTCLQHGDFWFGNIMFERGARAGMASLIGRFRVIDWGSSRSDGYPGIDAARFLLSTFGPGARSARHFGRYCRHAKLSLTDASVGCLCALGRLASELNEFPKPNFVAMVANVHGFLDRCGALDDMRRQANGA